ncbi:MAG: hypothetical protein K2X38_01455 [Gemmataceae bacterium]|nr:hypothetical protein [Gemmataceae bacterium]
MADGTPGSLTPPAAPWTRLFSAFRIALDLKNLILAAAGILATAAGWYLLSVAFYTNVRPTFNASETDVKKRQAAWKDAKIDRDRWNLLHRLAGHNSPPVTVDALDVAPNYEVYERLNAIVQGVAWANKAIEFKEGEFGFGSTFLRAKDPAILKELQKGAFRLGSLVFKQGKDSETIEFPNGASIEVVGVATPLKTSFEAAKSLESFRLAYANEDAGKQAILLYEAVLLKPYAMPGGKYRTLPWFEDRGENPFLLVSRAIASAEGKKTDTRGLGQTFLDQIEVLFEPLAKLLSPVITFFSPQASGFRNRTYLILVTLWALAVWGFFGGAISRIAVVQAARNEKAPLTEALAFVRQRFISYFSAPVMPLVLVLVVILLLAIFGTVVGWIPWVGEILFAGLLWPLVIIAGLVMAVVLVGLIGWPLMNPTISAEGSDSFDALSRSYSYVFQKPWHYLWYSVVSLLYGAALVFFVGFMGSLIVYLGSLGFSQAPGLVSEEAKNDRSPAYLFQYAPTSFGWRDLLLHENPHATLQGDGHYHLSEDYIKNMSIPNYIGGFLVSAWIWLVFMLVLGFGYSYFWTASSIIYLLMRNRVDETDTDEVYLDDEDLTPPSSPTPAAPATPAAVPAKPGTVSLNVVQGPPPSPTPVATVSPVHTPAVAPITPVVAPTIPMSPPPQDVPPRVSELPTPLPEAKPVSEDLRRDVP